MKQYITVEEARTQLSGRAFETAIVWIEEHNYRDWFNKDGYIPTKPFLTIGQMFEFLAENELPTLSFDGGNAMYWGEKREFLSAYLLCDKLWEAVKEVLVKGELK